MVFSRLTHCCLSCRFFRPVDEQKGLCRVDKATIDHRSYPFKAHEDSCQRWQDCGQQYHIRIGWLNNRKDQTGVRSSDS